MGILRGAIKTKLTTKAGLIAAGVVVIGGGAAIAAPGVTLTGAQDTADDVAEVLPANDDLEAMAAHCDENPDDPFCKGDSYHGDNVDGFSAWVRSVPSDWGCIRGQLISYAATQGPHGDHIEDLDFVTAEEAATYLAEVRDDPGFLDRTCVTNVLGAAEEEVVEEDEDVGNAEGFSAWVRSVPSEWGCIRGQLVSSVAGADRSDDDLEALSFTSAEEAAAHLAGELGDPGFLDRRCVEVAIARDGDSAEQPGPGTAAEGSGNGEGPGNGNVPERGEVPGNRGGDAPGKGNGSGNGGGNGKAPGNGNGGGNGPANGNGPSNGGGNGNR